MDIAARVQAYEVVTDRGGRWPAQPAMPGTDELTLPVEVVHQRVHPVDHLIVRTAQEPAWQPVEHRADLDGPAGVLLLRDRGGDEFGLHWRSPPYAPIGHHCRVFLQPGQPILGHRTPSRPSTSPTGLPYPSPELQDLRPGSGCGGGTSGRGLCWISSRRPRVRPTPERRQRSSGISNSRMSEPVSARNRTGTEPILLRQMRVADPRRHPEPRWAQATLTRRDDCRAACAHDRRQIRMWVLARLTGYVVRDHFRARTANTVGVGLPPSANRSSDRPAVRNPCSNSGSGQWVAPTLSRTPSSVQDAVVQWPSR